MKIELASTALRRERAVAMRGLLEKLIERLGQTARKTGLTQAERRPS